MDGRTGQKDEAGLAEDRKNLAHCLTCCFRSLPKVIRAAGTDPEALAPAERPFHRIQVDVLERHVDAKTESVVRLARWSRIGMSPEWAM